MFVFYVYVYVFYVYVIVCRVAVHAIISISRMKFLVRRWKKTKKSSRKAWSQDPAGIVARRINHEVRHSTEEIEQPGLSFV